MNRYRLWNSRRPLAPNRQRVFCNSGSPREAESLVLPNGVKPANSRNSSELRHPDFEFEESEESDTQIPAAQLTC